MPSENVAQTAEQQATVELLWGLREAPSRGPKPALSVERIAQVAVEIADREGLAAVSMQRVASELDFTKMSLYRYVAGKSELFATMIEIAVGEPPDLQRVPGDWRDRLTAYATRMWAAWERHPWLPGVTVGDRMVGPRELGWVESALRVLAETGLEPAEQLDAVRLLSGHIRNTQSPATAGTGTAAQQLGPTVAELLEEHRERYPAFNAVIADGARMSHDNGRQFGLQRILDGIEVLVRRRQRR